MEVATDVRIDGVVVLAVMIGGREESVGTIGATTAAAGMVTLGGSTLVVMSLRLRRVDRRGTLGVRIPTEMRLSRSARSASRSTMMAGAWILPFGIRMGAGGPFRELADLGGGVLGGTASAEEEELEAVEEEEEEVDGFEVRWRLKGRVSVDAAGEMSITSKRSA